MRLKSVFPSLIPLLLLLAGALASRAQQEIVSTDHWRVQAGDNPAWATPELDDSAWAATGFPVTSTNEPKSIGWHWYRATIQVPSRLQGQSLALGMPALDEAYEVFLNGKLVGRFGTLEPSPWGIFPRHAVFQVPSGLITGPGIHIALRRFRGPWSTRLQVFSASGSMNFKHPPRLGDQAAVQTQERSDMVNGAIQNLASDLTSILFLFAAAIGFVLYSVQRRRPEYLWLCLYCIASGAAPLIGILITTSQVLGSRSWAFVLVQTLGLSASAFSTLFLAVLCRRFRRVLLGAAILAGLAVVIAAYGMAADASFQVPFIYLYTYFPLLFQFVAVVGLLLDRNKGSLTIGLFLLMQGAVTVWYNTRILLHHTAGFTFGPFRIDPRNIASILFIFAVLIVLYSRYREAQEKQWGLEREMTAARDVQQYLIPNRLPETPGLAIQSEYRPSREVGGDFFQILPQTADGSVLIVVGDVAGKGLQAGMLATLIVGAIRMAAEFTCEPGQILALLNKRLQGRGLVTCLALRIACDGSTALANAGHLPPYLNGQEMAVEGALPLGAVPGIQFPVLNFTLAPGDSMVLMTDGVAEARDAEGRLFGFDRIAEMLRTGTAAAALTTAAQSFGQEDDITVLTLSYAGVPVSA